MADRTIKSNRLTPNATYLVRGKVGYSKIKSQTTDAERERDNKNRAQRGVHPVDKNYTTITIYDAQVLCKNPQVPTIEEQYAAESLYFSSNQTKYPGNNFSAMNKTKYLPVIGVKAPTAENPNNYAEIVPEGELAVGLDVTLVMRVYKGQGSNNGVSLDRVLVNEPIKYYGGNSEVDKTLSAFGITFQAMPPEAKAAAKAAVQVETPAQTPVQNTAPVQNNTFAQAPMQSTAPTQAAPVQNNAFAQAPVQNAAPAATDNPFSSYGQAPSDIQIGPARQY